MTNGDSLFEKRVHLLKRVHEILAQRNELDDWWLSALERFKEEALMEEFLRQRGLTEKFAAWQKAKGHVDEDPSLANLAWDVLEELVRSPDGKLQ